VVALRNQVEMGGLSDEKAEAQEIEAGYVWRERLWSAMRQFVFGFVDVSTGLKGYDGCAYHLNRRWEPKGRPVTPAALNNALKDSERNNFRAEWLDWFAGQDKDIADILARRVKPAKTWEQRYHDLVAEMREDLSHKRVEVIVRRADAR
jgi:hypothetical protein